VTVRHPDHIPTDLTLALHEGAFEEPLWASFLTGLRLQTEADYAGLILRNGEEVTVLQADLYPEELRTGDFEKLYTSDPGPHHRMVTGRIYVSRDFFDDAGAEHVHFYHQVLVPAGIPHGRMMRVEEPGGGEACCAIARGRQDFPPGAETLMTSLVPHLRAALRTFTVIQRERLRASISGDVVHRLNLGWLTLDAAGHVIGRDDEGGRLLRASPLQIARDGRLSTGRALADRELAELLRAAQSGATIRARLIHLSDEPWRDMLVAPVMSDPLLSGERPVLAVYLAGDPRSETERCEQLMALFKLSQNEARLALALSHGRTIREAADELGLTPESARTYSKRVYAKTGARGQSDLVRLILASVIALA